MKHVWVCLRETDHTSITTFSHTSGQPPSVLRDDPIGGYRPGGKGGIVPIYRLLQEQAFGPEILDAVTTAFEDILRVLRLTDRNDPLATLIAKRIIEVAQMGERNPNRI